MQTFSLISHNLEKYEAETTANALLQPAPAWSKKQATEEAKKKRVAKACENYWHFDKTYFPAEMYGDGYFAPGAFHKELFNLALTPGIHVILGARKHGKTVTYKKILVWLLLTGRVSFAGTYSETLPNARAILGDIAELIIMNPRITSDFAIDVMVNNEDHLQFRIKGERALRSVRPYSEGRSVRGSSQMFERPQWMLVDDLETRQSSFGTEQVQNRIWNISEAYQSLSENGTIVICGNNFDERCALNQLLTEQKDGILAENWDVHTYPAWNDEKQESLWPEKYDAKSEFELKARLKPADDGEWYGDFQQEPTPPAGFIFTRANYREWSEIPSDARGVMYCDPNLSLKGKGDTTAIAALLYSPTTDMYYIPKFRCRSFSDSNQLLDALFDIRATTKNCYTIGFDGHVTQESVWTNNVRNWSRVRKIPAPRIEYRRYNVNDLAKNAQSFWQEGRIFFPNGFSKTPDGKTAIKQIFAFKGKKPGKKDDAPDVLICLFELIHERGIARKASKSGYRSIAESHSL